jgi:amino acid permease
MKSLNSLSPFSLMGLGGTLYTAIFMAIRYFDKSYSLGGRFFELVSLRPSFNQRGPYTLNHLTFVLLSMLSTAYIAHYNAPQFYNELYNNSMLRFNTLVGTSFGLAIGFFIFIMSIGFLTFGGNTSSFILNNYASTDTLATLARFAIGLALLTGYPFTFSALREGLLDLSGKKDKNERNRLFTPLTMSLLSLVTALALVLTDVGFVCSITGALFGCFLMFIVPAIMNIKNPVAPVQGIEKLGNMGMMATGLVMGALGIYVSVARQLGKL